MRMSPGDRKFLRMSFLIYNETLNIGYMGIPLLSLIAYLLRTFGAGRRV
jgi:hypothetical protein